MQFSNIFLLLRSLETFKSITANLREVLMEIRQAAANAPPDQNEVKTVEEELS